MTSGELLIWLDKQIALAESSENDLKRKGNFKAALSQAEGVVAFLKVQIYILKQDNL